MLVQVYCDKQPQPLLVVVGSHCRIETLLTAVRGHCTAKTLTLVMKQDNDNCHSPSQRRRQACNALCLGFANDIKWVEGVDCGEELVRTHFSSVYYGTLLGKSVAIKKLNAEKTPVEQMEITMLNAARSEHIVKFIGVYLDFEENVSLVFEYASQDTVLSKLRNKVHILTRREGLTWFQQTVKAVNVLHSHSIVHRDIKTPNLLISGDGSVRLCDFGQAHYLANAPLYPSPGTRQYSPPEIFRGDLYSRASDVYALAIVLWEICNRVCTGEYLRPYKNISRITNDLQLLRIVAEEQLRPTLPLDLPDSLRELMQRMWHDSPSKRPECADILNELESIVA